MIALLQIGSALRIRCRTMPDGPIFPSCKTTALGSGKSMYGVINAISAELKKRSIRRETTRSDIGLIPVHISVKPASKTYKTRRCQIVKLNMGERAMVSLVI